MKVTIVFFYLLFLSGCSMVCDMTNFTVYYIPLDVNLYVPPTPEYLEKAGVKIVVRSCDLARLFEEIKNNTGETDTMQEYKMIRIKIVKDDDQKVIYITQNKTILSEWKKFTVEKKIIEAALSEIINATRNVKKPVGW